jgi:subtilisin family serine protease
VVSRRVIRQPVRVGQTYFHCHLSVIEWRLLVKRDETDPTTGEPTNPKDRAIYRIWPDFPIKTQINRSVATVKADAALRAYEASGKGIVWVVIDSGVDVNHPHFGLQPGAGHTLLDPAVADLHRDFSDFLPDPDEDDPKNDETERKKRLDAHRTAALTDEFGHGSHVAGIIAGGLTEKIAPQVDFHLYERKFKLDDQDRKKPTELEERTGQVDPARLRGIAPSCLLISLKVLDDNGNGRTSNVIQALDYIRANLNANPKSRLAHGVNLSLGYEFDAQIFACGQSPLCVEVDRLVQTGVVVVTAAGNTGYGTVQAQERPTARVGLANTINDPGNAALAITVGATHRDSPHTYGVSYFSSKGPTGDGRLKPDLVAPGERIISCAAGANIRFIHDHQPVKPPLPAAVPDGGAAPQAPAAPAAKPLAAYIDESGTSMAAPHVSGVIAAFLSIRPEFVGRPVDVKKIFLDSATSLGRERYFEGHGLVDLMRAIQSV